MPNRGNARPKLQIAWFFHREIIADKVFSGLLSKTLPPRNVHFRCSAKIVDRLPALADLQPDDVLYDLGSGDGGMRWPLPSVLAYGQ